MTAKTEQLLSDITNALFEKKAVLLMGNTGVGKTYLAKQAIKALEKKEYSCFPDSVDQAVITEIVSCHNSVSYEDFVGGIAIETQSGLMSFSYKDKILIETINNAAKDYYDKKGTRYVLLLDDMQRCELSALLGDAIAVIGNESEIIKLYLNSGASIDVTPNFYIIGTYNAAETGAVPIPRELLSRFYTIEVLSDIKFITDDTESEKAELFYQVRSLVLNYLDMQYRTSTYEQNRYLPGHGYFAEDNTVLKIIYQLIPTLKQYVAEGILDSDAEEPIRLLENACNTRKKKTELSKRNEDCFDDYKRGVTPDLFCEEESTRSCSSIPIENLVGRIIEQHLLSNDSIKNRILFNKKICYREMEVEGITYQANLVATNEQHNRIRRGGKPTERCLYNGGTLTVDGEQYYFTGGYHPKDYVKDACWSNKDGYKLGESFGGNLVIFRIVWQYYQALIDELKLLVKDNPSDINSRKLLHYMQAEWDRFFEEFKGIEPKPVDKTIKGWKNIEAGYNQEANKKVRQLISELTILWKDPGETILLGDGTEIILEGVDSDMSESIFKEYWEAMETLSIKQMILQGPPGTSKTYSAKEFLKYMAGNCSDAELAEMQISDYSQEDKYCTKLIKGHSRPTIAWDIVQFHPSYGYEDFIRGIKVSTNNNDTIKYETVNKILGNIAELARKEKNKNTKFFLVIDEINRANLATVFGELIYGLEYRTESIATPYSVNNDNRISLPDNLYILGTMNTADKSIGGIDYAIRRRFLFFELLPDESVIRNYNADKGEKQKELNEKACKLFNSVKKVFDDDYLSPEYRREDVQIGHTYFLVDSEEKLMRRFEYQIVPILKEYYKDGIISFDLDESKEGFWGFLNCISGRIDLTAHNDDLESIFKSLIA